MDRRGFLRATSLVVRPVLPWWGIVWSLLKREESPRWLSQVLWGYWMMANELLERAWIKTWPYAPKPENVAIVFPLLKQVADKAWNVIRASSSTEAFETIFSVDPYFATQIFCKHFWGFTKEQRSQAMEKLFFVREIDKDGMEMTEDNLSDWLSGPKNSLEHHHSFLANEQYLARWLHKLSARDFHNFIDAIPEFWWHFHEWTVWNFFSEVFDAENYVNHELWIERLVQLYEKTPSPRWRRLFVWLMADEIEDTWLSMAEFSSVGLNTNLMKQTGKVLDRIAEAETTFWEITVDNVSSWFALRNTIIDEVLTEDTVALSIALWSMEESYLEWTKITSLLQALPTLQVWLSEPDDDTNITESKTNSLSQSSWNLHIQ